MNEIIKHWDENLKDGDELKTELRRLLAEDENTLHDCFYRSLAFGTGGMRGELGVGPNRMNRYTVRKAALGLAQSLKNEGAVDGRIVIAYDSRHQSEEFARESALTLIHEGFSIDLFEQLRPTPMLSFAVREQKALAGIMITASHNPPEYNGVKVYDREGAQLTLEKSDELIRLVNNIEDELLIPAADYEESINNGRIAFLGDAMDEHYNETLQTILPQRELGLANGGDLNIVFTPLHGTAYVPVTKALETNGYRCLSIVKEQAEPDPDFSTVKLPNPEEAEAFKLAMIEGEKTAADLLIATDPDADRVGIAVPSKKHDGGYRLLTGNETGLLLMHYLLEKKTADGSLLPQSKVLKTIVTSESGRHVADHFGVQCVDTLTGFKFIAEKIQEYETTDEAFVFGYEESYGYLIGSFVRDKDAVQSALLISELALDAKQNGRSLEEKLTAIYDQFGYYKEKTNSIELKGQAGAEQISRLLASLRDRRPTDVGGISISEIEDYTSGERLNVQSGLVSPIELPTANVLKYFLSDETWICVRPSGTEPKVKVYFGVRGVDYDDADRKLDVISEAMMTEINHRLSLRSV